MCRCICVGVSVNGGWGGICVGRVCVWGVGVCMCVGVVCVGYGVCVLYGICVEWGVCRGISVWVYPCLCVGVYACVRTDMYLCLYVSMCLGAVCMYLHYIHESVVRFP